jgi:hypothetical protein
MARKIAQHSTDKKGLSKVGNTWMTIKDAALCYFPERSAWRQRLIYSLEQWVNEKDEKGRLPLEVMQFCSTYKIPYQTFIRWCHDHEDIGQVYTNVKLTLASRRRVGAMFRDYDKDAVYKDLHRLDPEWHEINMYHAALKDKERSDNEQKIVIIERFPETDVVPKKVTHEVE